MRPIRYIFWVLLLNIPELGLASNLVSDETIALQKGSTVQFELPGKIPVIYRRIEGNEIFEITTAFAYGEAHVPKSQQLALNLTLGLMDRGSKTWPKAKLYALLEKYGSGINCGLSVETSFCRMAILQENLPELLPVFASILLDPELNRAEANLILRQTEAGIKASEQNPESYVSEVVNQLYYGLHHPYWMPMAQELSFLKKIDTSKLRGHYQRFIKNSHKMLVVVADLPVDELKAMLVKNFTGLMQGKSKILPPPKPVFSPQQSFAIIDRNIPTAYISAKFHLPGVTEKDGPAADLMVRILSEELDSEIRTKRSLSYSVFAQSSSLSLGHGKIQASTSRPEETLEAMVPVIKKMREHRYSKIDLERHKTIYTTGYFLTLEEHSSLANGLAFSQLYFGTNDRLYMMPRDLEKVSAEDVQRVAQKYLKEFRLAVVFKAKDFNKSWADKFLQALN